MIDNYGDQFSAIRYHVSWPSAGDPFYQYNIPENTMRTNFYNVPGVPYDYMDGAYVPYSIFETRLLQRLNVDSPLDINITGNYDSQNRDVDINVSVEATGEITQNNINFYCVLTESAIRWIAPNGVPTHNQVMRDMIPNANGEPLNIAQGETAVFERSFHVDDIIVDNLADIVVFVQAYYSKEVLQCARVSVTDIPTQTGVEELSQGGLPRTVTLGPNYPNPFNAQTNIAFHLIEGSEVNLSVYNILGEKVAELAQGRYDAGSHIVSWDATGEASGVYFYRLKANSEIRTNRMVLMK